MYTQCMRVYFMRMTYVWNTVEPTNHPYITVDNPQQRSVQELTGATTHALLPPDVRPSAIQTNQSISLIVLGARGPTSLLRIRSSSSFFYLAARFLFHPPHT